jgi:hypothetical protein
MENIFYDIPWLENVGNDLKSSSQKIVGIKKLQKVEEMYKSNKSLTWENFNLDIRNNMTSFVRKEMADEYKSWNKIAEGIRNLFEDSRLHIESRINNLQLNIEIITSIRSHFIAIAQYYTYFSKSKHRKNKYYEVLFEIYKNGNFPCGWDGKPIGNIEFEEMKFDSGSILIW